MLMKGESSLQKSKRMFSLTFCRLSMALCLRNHIKTFRLLKDDSNWPPNYKPPNYRLSALELLRVMPK